jgi:uncharacterized protein
MDRMHHAKSGYAWKRPAILLAGALLFAACTTDEPPSQAGPEPGPKPFAFGVVEEFYSNALNEPRTLNIYLPDGYADSTLAYPVVYVLDGSANEDYPHIAGLMQFMNMYELHPKSIVVGIANVDRRRDFSFPTRVDSDRAAYPTTGGSARFIQFMEQELQPYVHKHYRVQGDRTIIGQSLGGLLAAEILVTKPQLFDNYVIVSPSLWWDSGSIIARTDSFLTASGDLPKRVYVSIGTEGDDMQVYMDQYLAAFRQHARPPMQWWYVPMPEETHATILHRSAYCALELLNGEE